jgi:hypothetical protein
MSKENLIETIEYEGCKIEVLYATDAENPIKEWDMLGKFICFHRNYDLGNVKGFDTKEEVLEYAEKHKCRLYPLYLYDHSGITISLSPFSCPWDSGQVGWVMLEPADVRKEFGKKRISKKIWEIAENRIEGEVETYDQYLRGEVYEFVAYDKDGDIIDSCSGFYGDTKDMIDEAKQSVDSFLGKEKAKAA